MIFSNKLINLKEFNPNLVKYINDIVKNNVFVSTVIVFESTKGMTSEIIKMINKSSKLKFRITGGFDSERISSKKKNKKLIEEEYLEPITYTREELYNILVAIEKLESNIDSEYILIEKALYIYDVLRKHFNYKYYKSDKTKRETDSLRSLLTKNISSKGISLIYKELLCRQGINSHYVEGNLISSECRVFHAWNIIEISGKFIPADLYLDILGIRKGYLDIPLYFGETTSFSKIHEPSNIELVQVYETALYTVTSQSLMDILDYIKTKKGNIFSVNLIEREDGSEGLFSFIGKEKFNDKIYEKIIYLDILENVVSNPSVLYLDADIKVSDDELFINGKSMNEENLQIIYNKLLSPVNVRTGLTLNNGYIGTLGFKDEKLDILYDSKAKGNIKNIQKTVIRSDKTTFVLEKINPFNPDEISNKYKMYEIKHNDRFYIEEYTLYTEKDIIGNNDPKFIDEVFSVNNISNAVKYKGGYLGYFNPSEIKIIEKKEYEEKV